MINLDMKNYNLILTEKNISIPSDQSRIREQAKFICSKFTKSFWKTNKNNWRPRKKTSWSFKVLKPEES